MTDDVAIRRRIVLALELAPDELEALQGWVQGGLVAGGAFPHHDKIRRALTKLSRACELAGAPSSPPGDNPPVTVRREPCYIASPTRES